MTVPFLPCSTSPSAHATAPSAPQTSPISSRPPPIVAPASHQRSFLPHPGVAGRSFSHPVLLPPPLPPSAVSMKSSASSALSFATDVPEEQKRRFESFTRQLMSERPDSIHQAPVTQRSSAPLPPNMLHQPQLQQHSLETSIPPHSLSISGLTAMRSPSISAKQLNFLQQQQRESSVR